MWSLDPAPPALDKRDELGTFDDTVIRAPADTDLQTTLTTPIAAVDIPDPLGATNGDDGNAAAGDEDRRGGLAVADAPDVRDGERAAALGHLGGREAAGDLAAEVREVFELRGKRVHVMCVDVLERGRVEARRRRQCDVDVGVWAERESGPLARGGIPRRSDGGAEERPFEHRF